MGFPGRRGLSLGEALALGALQGPTELLPVSSSGHTTLVPWLAGRPYGELDPELRKSFEVALHAGAGAALAIDMRKELAQAVADLDRRGAVVIGLSLAPAALAGYAFEHTIEERLGGPRSIAVGLLAGGVAMWLADTFPGGLVCATKGGARARTHTRARAPRRGMTPPWACRRRMTPAWAPRRRIDAGPWDGLALGIAQALALIPGVSRNGATLTAARGRGFAREDATALSWHAGLPVILGASALKGWRLTRRRPMRRRPMRHGGAGPEPAAGASPAATSGAGPAVLVGAMSAFVSTLAAGRILGGPRVRGRPLGIYAIYRCLLAAVVLRRCRRKR